MVRPSLGDTVLQTHDAALTSYLATSKSAVQDVRPQYEQRAVKVDYTYYGAESFGEAGDLKLVTTTTPLTDSGVSLTRKTYYRYRVRDL